MTANNVNSSLGSPQRPTSLVWRANTPLVECHSCLGDDDDYLGDSRPELPSLGSVY